MVRNASTLDVGIEKVEMEFAVCRCRHRNHLKILLTSVTSCHYYDLIFRLAFTPFLDS